VSTREEDAARAAWDAQQVLTGHENCSGWAAVHNYSEAAPFHPCPYQVEVRGHAEPWCQCCTRCTHYCADTHDD
jgi:hypothetical protein